jgi:hypothetical protein
MRVVIPPVEISTIYITLAAYKKEESYQEYTL